MYGAIREISFEEILPFWKDKLWPSRESAIESHSAMLYKSDKYVMGNFSLPVWYLGYYVAGRLVGVNSGHMCIDRLARSRGLWVEQSFRQNGFGKALLTETVNIAKRYTNLGTWSYPRLTSFPTYQAAGFELTGDWSESETSEANAYVFRKH